MRILLLFTVALLPVLSSAQAPSPTPSDLVVNGRTYKHARIQRVEPDGITYMYDGGMSKFDFAELPGAVRKQYNYDPARAARFAAADDAQQQAIFARGQEIAKQAAAQEAQARSSANYLETQKLTLQEIRDAGFPASMKVERGTDQGIVGTLYATTGSAPHTLLDADTREATKMHKAIIMGVNLADGESWAGMVYPCGVYRGRAIGYSASSMRAYATTPEAALELYKR